MNDPFVVETRRAVEYLPHTDWLSLIPAAELYKFVVLDNEKLIIADMTDHSGVLLLWKYPPAKAGEILLKEGRQPALKRIRSEFAGRVTAAGLVAKDGTVVEWHSDGFKVETPHELREVVQAQIREVLADGGWAGIGTL